MKRNIYSTLDSNWIRITDAGNCLIGHWPEIWIILFIRLLSPIRSPVRLRSGISTQYAVLVRHVEDQFRSTTSEIHHGWHLQTLGLSCKMLARMIYWPWSTGIQRLHNWRSSFSFRHGRSRMARTPWRRNGTRSNDHLRWHNLPWQREWRRSHKSLSFVLVHCSQEVCSRRGGSYQLGWHRSTGSCPASMICQSTRPG